MSKQIKVDWTTDFEDQKYVYAPYSVNVYNMFVAAINERLNVIGFPTHIDPTNTVPTIIGTWRERPNELTFGKRVVSPTPSNLEGDVIFYPNKGELQRIGQYGDLAIESWVALQSLVYFIAKYFVKNMNYDRSFGAEGFFNDKDIINDWTQPTRNQTYLDNRDHLDRVWNLPEDKYNRYGPPDYYIPKLFRRKWPREISTFDNYGEEGQKARFVYKGYPFVYKNKQNLDWQYIVNTDLKEWSGDMYKFTKGEWVRIILDDIKNPDDYQPDIIESDYDSAGLGVKGDYFGGWFLNDLRDAINLLIWTFATHNAMSVQRNGFDYDGILNKLGGISGTFYAAKWAKDKTLKLLDQATNYLYMDDNQVHPTGFKSMFSIKRKYFSPQQFGFSNSKAITNEQEEPGYATGILGSFPVQTGAVSREFVQIKDDKGNWIYDPGPKTSDGYSTYRTQPYIYFFGGDLEFSCEVDLYAEIPVLFDRNDNFVAAATVMDLEDYIPPVTGQFQVISPGYTRTITKDGTGAIVMSRTSDLRDLRTDIELIESYLPRVPKTKPAYQYSYRTSVFIDKPHRENKVAGTSYNQIGFVYPDDPPNTIFDTSLPQMMGFAPFFEDSEHKANRSYIAIGIFRWDTSQGFKYRKNLKGTEVEYTQYDPER